MVLSDQKVIQLSMITVKGSNDTPQQHKIRQLIRYQQEELVRLNENNIIHNRLKQTAISDIAKFLKGFGIYRLGISKILRDAIYSGKSVDQKEQTAIIIAYQLNFENMKTVPSHESATEIMNSYNVTGNAIVKLTQFLQSRGYIATGHHPMGNLKEEHVLLFPPHAYQAGMGEKGRTGLFIDHQLGPMVRLGMITTSLELKKGKPNIKGINAFCHRCQYCVKKCPPRALPSMKYLISIKENKPMNFKIDADKCFKYFEKHFACGKCIFHCILTKTTTDDIQKRMKRIETWYNRWIISGELTKLQNVVL